MTDLAKTVDAPASELQRLRDRFEDLSEDVIPKTANELTRIAALGGQLGVATGALEGFVQTVAALDVSTDLGAEEAATQLAQLAEVMGTAEGDFDRLGSTLVDLGNNLATAESQILAMGQRIAGAGRQVGLSEAQVLGFAGALASLGVEAQAGGSAISRVFSNMATAAASGGEELAGFAAVAGQSAAAFRQAFQKDAGRAVLSFIRGLEELEAQGENVFGVLDQLGLGELRVRDALLRMAGGADTVAEALDRGEQAWTDNLALTEEARKFYEQTGSELKRLGSEAVNLAAEFGRTLTPSFRAAMDVGRALLDGVVRPAIAAFQALPRGIQGAAIAAAALGAALGPVLTVGGNLLRTFSGLTRAANALIGMRALGGLAALLTPGGAIAAGLATTVLLMASFAETVEQKAIRAVDEFRQKIQQLVDDALAATKFVREATMQSLVALLKAETARLESLQERLREMAPSAAVGGIRGGLAVLPGGGIFRQQIGEFQALGAKIEESRGKLEGLREELQRLASGTWKIAVGLVPAAGGGTEGGVPAPSVPGGGGDGGGVTFSPLTLSADQRRAARGFGPQEDLSPSERFGRVAAEIEEGSRTLTEFGERMSQQQQQVAIFATSLEDSLGRAFSNVITGAQSVGDALLNMVNSVLSSIADQAASSLVGSLLGGILPGFQHGGEFQVGGSGGPDSQLVAFRATPGEHVAVTPGGGGRGRAQTVNNNFHIAPRVTIVSPDSMTTSQWARRHKGVFAEAVLDAMRQTGVM